MNPVHRSSFWCGWILGTATFAGATHAADPQAEHFERHIRPVLEAECVSCHGPEKNRGELRLDVKQGILAGGSRGSLFNFEEVQESLLLKVVSHEHEDRDLHMPRSGAKLSEAAIAAFRQWIAEGAAIPEYQSASRLDPWEHAFEERKKWWSFQSLEPSPSPPEGSGHPVDAFLGEQLHKLGLTPAAIATWEERRRRLHYRLTGVPPRYGAEAISWEEEVDRVLASPAYGEQMARHWMDLVRYADSHGSEGDPVLPYAHQYRDYLVRAFQADVPYDRFTQEHLAGDLLSERLDPVTGLKDSVIALAHLRMNEYGYQPVDTLDEQVKAVDNVIDVYSKTFLGLTVSCARCHDHKFDPISQKDYFGIYGIFDSSRPVQRLVSKAQVEEKENLAKLKTEIQQILAEKWLEVAKYFELEGSQLEERLAQYSRAEQDLERWWRQAELPQVVASTQAANGWIKRYTFEPDAALEGELHGKAQVKAGQLWLDGAGSYFQTEPLEEALEAKTLEAWVKLADFTQRGGGVLTVETLDGRVFDSVVFGELEPGSWMAGSDHGKRSLRIQQREDSQAWVHLAVVYTAEGDIQLYRNGQRYGKSYRPKHQLVKFDANQYRVLIGRRHTGGGRAFLKGAIEEVSLYGQALTFEAIMQHYQQGPSKFNRSEWVRGLDGPRRIELHRLQLELEQAERGFGPLSASQARAWQQFFNDPQFKEWVMPTSVNSVQAASLEWMARRAFRESHNQKHFKLVFDASNSLDVARWFGHVDGQNWKPSKEGEFQITSEGDQAISQLLPAGLYSQLLTNRASAMLLSPRYDLELPYVWSQHLGTGGAGLRMIIDHYPLNLIPTFPQSRPNLAQLKWHRLDGTYRLDSNIYLEFTANADSPRPANVESGTPSITGGFGVTRIYASDQGEAAPVDLVQPKDWVLKEFARWEGLERSPTRFAAMLQHATRRWAAGEVSEEARAFLNGLMERGLLPVELRGSPELARCVETYRMIEQQIPTPVRAPGMLEAEGIDAKLMHRGNHKDLKDAVPRGFLKVLSPENSHEFGEVRGSGRYELAMATTSRNNPLFARVMVNRVWTWVFGKGLVSSVDNFGRLGDPPTHPELLDYLSNYFIEHDYSIKSLFKLLLTSEAFQRSVETREADRDADPSNQWYGRGDVIRLSAEQIRDSVLAISGRLDPAMGGPPVAHESMRRSLYLLEKRNAPQPFLEVFDKPKPASTRGLRDRTNLPAQSLTLLNDPFVMDSADAWSTKLLALQPANAAEAVEQAYRDALNREARPEEVEVAVAFLGEDWQAQLPAFLHAMFSLKEFIYLR